MKKLFSTFSLFSILFLASCSDKDDDSGVQQPPAAIQCRPIASSSVIGDSIHFIYDASNRLIKYHYVGNSQSDINISYDSNNRIYQLSRNSGFVFQQRFYNNTGLLEKIVGYTDLLNGKIHTGETIMQYTNAGKLKATLGYDASVNPKELVSQNKYTLNAAGLIETDSLFFYRQNGTSYYWNTVSYQYDNKIGVAKFNLQFAVDELPYIFYPLEHNIISETKITSGGQISTITTKYEYNQYGYPVKQTLSQNGFSVEVKTDYNCF